jgi:hypothetical protein
MMTMGKCQLEFDIHLEMIVSDVDAEKLYQTYMRALRQRTIDIPGRETIKAKLFSLEGSQSDEMEL